MSFFDRFGKTNQGKRSCSGADLSELVASNIKAGVTIAGVTGSYPSSSNPLTGADGTADLSDNQATREGQLRSATSFEYFKSDGTRVVAAGDADIVATNIKDTVEILGITGSYTGSPPNEWDLRAGVTVGSVTGKLKTSCRNSANLTYFDQAEVPKSATVNNSTNTITVTSHGWSDNQTVRIYHFLGVGGLNHMTTYYIRNSTTNTLQLSTTSGGAAIDITSDGSSVYLYRWGDAVVQDWDTLDDYYGTTTSFPSAWTSSQNLCGGIETVADDTNVWKDVTTTGDGVTASTCIATSAHCSFRDKISGLEWHKADNTDRHWAQAYSFCSDLSHNGKTDWRLPTQKELMGAYHNGMMATAGATNWITLANLRQSYWSSTSLSNDVYAAMSVTFYGIAADSYKSSGYRVICARP